MMSAKNEKVLYTVLRKISNDRQFIIDAFGSWSKDQASLTFDADGLVQYFETALGFDANEKRNFRIAFYAVSSRDESVLLEVPALLKKPQAGASSAAENGEKEAIPESNLSPQEKTFQAFLEVLVDSAKRIDADADVDLIDHFKDRNTLKAMKLTNRVETKLNAWIENDLNLAFNVKSMGLNDMKSLFHQVYISLCETLGPVKADQVLNRSIGKVEQLNTGFSVSSLI